jgi:hypothetical protein
MQYKHMRGHILASATRPVAFSDTMQSARMFCSTILGRHTLEAAEAEGQRMLETCIKSGDNYILNWAYWMIAWDYVSRGLTRTARIWALKLIESGKQREDNRAIGMAYWTLAWITSKTTFSAMPSPMQKDA